MSWMAGLKGQRVDPNTLNPYFDPGQKSAAAIAEENRDGWAALKAFVEQAR